MSTDREMTRFVRSWLEDGVTSLPDRVLDAVLDQLPATPQRRPLWTAWRFAHVSRSLQAALGAAALVVVVGIIGLNLFGTAGSGGQPTPTGTPIPTAMSIATPMAPPSGTAPRPLAPGSYVAADFFQLKVGFTVPAGWQGNVGGPYFMAVERSAPNTGGIYFNILGNVYANPCHPETGLASPPVGASVTELLTSLTHLQGVTATTPVDTTVAGYPAKALTLTPSGTCAGGVSVWQLPLGGTAGMIPGQQDHLWLLTVGATRLVIEVDEYVGQSAGAKAEVQAVLDSVNIAP